MIWLRKRLVAWLMPEIDLALRTRHQIEITQTATLNAVAAAQIAGAAVSRSARP